MRKMYGIMAVALAASMAFSSASLSLAADNEVTTMGGTVTSTGTGSLEGYVEKKVTKVVLPTQSDANTATSFLVDPQDLLSKGLNNSHTLADSANGGLYFKNASDSKYSATSDEMKVVNKSSYDIDVIASAKATTDIQLNSSANFDGVTAPSIYLALKGTDGTTPVTKAIEVAETSVDIPVKVAAVPGNFEVVYEGGKYKYQEAASASGWKDASFTLTGACNQNDDVDWSEHIDKDSQAMLGTNTVEITWTLREHVDNADPSLAQVGTMTSDTPTVINVDFGAGTLAATSVNSVVWKGDNKNYLGSTIKYADNKLTVAAASVNYFLTATNKTFAVTFDNGKVVEITLS